MWKKFLPLVGILALVIIVAAAVALTKKPALPTAEQQEEASAGAPALEPLPSVPQPAQPIPLSGGEQQAEAPVAAQPAPTTVPADMPPFVITYDGKSYTPASAEIKKGSSVLFLNRGTGTMWPASAMHPTHAVYPTKGGCVGSTFDACQALPQGTSWVFTFDEAGSWKYHDHLNPSAYGTIVVK